MTLLHILILEEKSDTQPPPPSLKGTPNLRLRSTLCSETTSTSLQLPAWDLLEQSANTNAKSRSLSGILQFSLRLGSVNYLPWSLSSLNFYGRQIAFQCQYCRSKSLLSHKNAGTHQITCKRDCKVTDQIRKQNVPPMSRITYCRSVSFFLMFSSSSTHLKILQNGTAWG